MLLDTCRLIASAFAFAFALVVALVVARALFSEAGAPEASAPVARVSPEIALAPRAAPGVWIEERPAWLAHSWAQPGARYTPAGDTLRDDN